jgi:hypothetical protein
MQIDFDSIIRKLEKLEYLFREHYRQNRTNRKPKFDFDEDIIGFRCGIRSRKSITFKDE